MGLLEKIVVMRGMTRSPVYLERTVIFLGADKESLSSLSQRATSNNPSTDKLRKGVPLMYMGFAFQYRGRNHEVL